MQAFVGHVSLPVVGPFCMGLLIFEGISDVAGEVALIYVG